MGISQILKIKDISPHFSHEIDCYLAERDSFVEIVEYRKEICINKIFLEVLVNIWLLP